MASTIWKGHLTFGLVSIPVKLTAAARSQTVGFNMLHKKDNSRVKQVLFCAAEDKPVERSELVKGYEYEKDRYVVIEEEDLKKVQPKSARTIEILEFVKASEVDPIYLESSYYLHPEESGEKAYTLLFAAMRKTGYSGVALVTLFQKEHTIILRPGSSGLLLHTMYFQDEVRSMDEFRTDPGIVQQRELDMAVSLIENLANPFDISKYKDTYRAALEEMIQAKIKGRKVVAAPAGPEMAPVIDIMEALKASLASRKRPPGREAEPAKPSGARKPSSRRSA